MKQYLAGSVSVVVFAVCFAFLPGMAAAQVAGSAPQVYFAFAGGPVDTATATSTSLSILGSFSASSTVFINGQQVSSGNTIQYSCNSGGQNPGAYCDGYSPYLYHVANQITLQINDTLDASEGAVGVVTVKPPFTLAIQDHGQMSNTITIGNSANPSDPTLLADQNPQNLMQVPLNMEVQPGFVTSANASGWQSSPASLNVPYLPNLSLKFDLSNLFPSYPQNLANGSAPGTGEYFMEGWCTVGSNDNLSSLFSSYDGQSSLLGVPFNMSAYSGDLYSGPFVYPLGEAIRDRTANCDLNRPGNYTLGVLAIVPRTVNGEVMGSPANNALAITAAAGFIPITVGPSGTFIVGTYTSSPLGPVPVTAQTVQYLKVQISNSNTEVALHGVQIYGANGNVITIPASNVTVSSNGAGSNASSLVVANPSSGSAVWSAGNNNCATVAQGLYMVCPTGYSGSFTLNLGTPTQVSRVSMLWSASGGIDPANALFQISGSTDGTNFTPLGTFDSTGLQLDPYPNPSPTTTDHPKWIDFNLTAGSFDVRDTTEAYVVPPASEATWNPSVQISSSGNSSPVASSSAPVVGNSNAATPPILSSPSLAVTTTGIITAEKGFAFAPTGAGWASTLSDPSSIAESSLRIDLAQFFPSGSTGQYTLEIWCNSNSTSLSDTNADQVSTSTYPGQPFVVLLNNCSYTTPGVSTLRVVVGIPDLTGTVIQASIPVTIGGESGSTTAGITTVSGVPVANVSSVSASSLASMSSADVEALLQELQQEIAQLQQEVAHLLAQGGQTTTGTTTTTTTTTTGSGGSITSTSAGTAICSGSTQIGKNFPEATLTGTDPNGLGYVVGNSASTPFYVNVGDTVTYHWCGANAVVATSTYTINSPDTCAGSGGSSGPLPWIANSMNGSTPVTVSACQAGHTYTYTYTTENMAGAQTGPYPPASASFVVQVLPVGGVETSSDETDYVNVPSTITVTQGSSATVSMGLTPGPLDVSVDSLDSADTETPTVSNLPSGATGAFSPATPISVQQLAQGTQYQATINVPASVVAGQYVITFGFTVQKGAGGGVAGVPLPRTATLVVESSGSSAVTGTAPVLSEAQGYNPTGLDEYTTGAVYPNQYLVLYGNFASSGNSILINGQPMVNTVGTITYQGAAGGTNPPGPDQINVSLGSLSGMTSLSVAVSNANGTSNAENVTVN